jgi:hypothetical protein
MVHVPKQLYLPQRPLGVNVVVEGVANLLDRNLLPCLCVDSSAAKRANLSRRPQLIPP